MAHTKAEVDKSKRVDELRGCVQWAEDRLWDIIEDVQDATTLDSKTVIERLMKVAKKLSETK